MRAFRRFHQRDALANPLPVFWLLPCHLWPRNGEQIRWTSFALSASISLPSARRIPLTRCGKSHAQSAWCTAAPILRMIYRRPTKSPITCAVLVLRFKWRRSLTRPTSERLHTQRSTCLSLSRVGFVLSVIIQGQCSIPKVHIIALLESTTDPRPRRVSLQGSVDGGWL